MEGSKLRLGRYSTAYRARLVAGGCQVQKFLDKKGIGLQSFLRCSDRVIDKLLEEFVTQNHRRQSSGRALRDTKHGILFVQISRPDLKHRLKSAWDTLKSWEESIPSQLRTPMPLPVMMAMLCYARVQGMQASNDIRMQNKWFQFSVLVSLGFFWTFTTGRNVSAASKTCGFTQQPHVCTSSCHSDHRETEEPPSTGKVTICNHTPTRCLQLVDMAMSGPSS